MLINLRQKHMYVNYEICSLYNTIHIVDQLLFKDIKYQALLKATLNEYSVDKFLRIIQC